MDITLNFPCFAFNNLLCSKLCWHNMCGPNTNTHMHTHTLINTHTHSYTHTKTNTNSYTHIQSTHAYIHAHTHTIISYLVTGTAATVKRIIFSIDWNFPEFHESAHNLGKLFRMLYEVPFWVNTAELGWHNKVIIFWYTKTILSWAIKA